MLFGLQMAFGAPARADNKIQPVMSWMRYQRYQRYHVGRQYRIRIHRKSTAKSYAHFDFIPNKRVMRSVTWMLIYGQKASHILKYTDYRIQLKRRCLCYEE